MLPSFDAYYGPFERGGASTGQALAALPGEIRRAVREEVRRDLSDTAGLSRRRRSIGSPAREGSELDWRADCLHPSPGDWRGDR